ncbi:MAG: alpha/beta fold hydrolase [Pseudomonadota bacterium]
MPAALILALGYLLLVSIPAQMKLPGELAITTSPADLGLAFENFSLQPEDAELTLQGWWIPADSPRAVLVFIHGRGSNRDSEFFGSLAFYAAMVERGVSVAAIDQRNHGASDRDPRGVLWGVNEKYDALAAIDWVRARVGDSLPLFVMGKSMGGGTVINAMAERPVADGAILLDPLLDFHSVVTHGGWVETGLPPAVFAPSAWAAAAFHGLPGGEGQALALASQLDMPILLMQDPDDPVTLAEHAYALAQMNPNVRLWAAPTVPPDHPDIAWRGRWGTHVAAFVLFPEQFLAQIDRFIGSLEVAQPD